MEIGIADPDVETVKNDEPIFKICNRQYLEWILGNYLNEIQTLDERLADSILWHLAPKKQESRQKRLDHLRNRCLPFVSDKMEALRIKACDKFRDLFEPL